MMISRLLINKASNNKFDAMLELKISPWLNSFFYGLISAELLLIKVGVKFPIGGSRFVIASKI